MRCPIRIEYFRSATLKILINAEDVFAAIILAEKPIFEIFSALIVAFI